MSESLKKTTIKNVGYNTIAKVISLVFQAITNIILSRKLGAGDYGIVGFAAIYVNFLRNFSDFGISNAATQSKDLDDKSLHTAFTLKLILSIGAFVVTILSAGLATKIFDNKAVVAVIQLLAVNLLINSFGFMPNILLMRSLDFKKLSIADNALTISSSLVAMAMALSGYKYWSIVVANIASTVVFVLILNIFRPTKISFCFDTVIARYYLKFGGKLFLSGLIAFVVTNVDNFIIGAVGGAALLGYYTIAFNWGSMICMLMGAIVLNVLFPTFVKIQNDLERMKQAYLKILQFSSFIGTSISVILICVSEDFLIYVLGGGTTKWIPALLTLKILCIYGMIRSLIDPIWSLIIAHGKPGVILKANIIAAIFELILVYPAAKYGSIEAVAIVVLIAYTAQIAVYLPQIEKLNNISALEIINAVKPAFLSFLATIGIYTYIGYIQFKGGIVEIVLSSLVMMIIYIFCYGAITRGKLYIDVKNMLVGK